MPLFWLNPGYLDANGEGGEICEGGERDSGATEFFLGKQLKISVMKLQSAMIY